MRQIDSILSKIEMTICQGDQKKQQSNIKNSKVIVATLMMPTWLQDLAEHPILNNEYVIWTVLGVISFAIKPLREFIFRIAKKIITRPVVYLDFSKLDIKDALKHYIPNEFNVHNEFDEPLEHADRHSRTLHDLLLKQLDGSINFIIAPTGVGKTTCTLNIANQYDRFFKRFTLSKMYVGKANSESTRKLIEQLNVDEAKKCIIILDGLDEFYISAREPGHPEKYWQEFDSLWQPLFVKLNNFGKVIITVRDQFFTQKRLSDFHFSNRFAERGLNVHLLPFEGTEIRQKYISKRFAKRSAEHQKNLLDFATEINRKGNEIIGQPLILNYLDELYEDHKIRIARRQETKFDTYYIYQTIVNHWFDREAKTKRINNQSFKLELQVFCAELAARISKHGKGNRISLTELQKFEHLNNSVPKFEGLADRALLKRHKIGKIEFFQFTHLSFLDFFIILYAEQSPDHEKDVNFINHEFAVNTLIGKRWRSVNKTGLISQRDLRTNLNVYSFALLTNWLNFSTKITVNIKLKLSLSDPDSQHYFWKIVQQEDEGSGAVIESLKEGIVNNQSLFDQGEHIGIVLGGLEFLKGWMVEFSLYNVRIRDQDLDVLGGTKSVRKLVLSQLGLNGSGLKNFSESIGLEHVDLSFNSIGDKALKIFQSMKTITYLDLRVNQISGAGFVEFRPTAPKLKTLRIAKNPILSNQFIKKAFEGTSQLEVLDISQNGEPIFLIDVFDKNLKTLHTLYLCGSELKDEQLSLLTNLLSLRHLDICHNQLNGSAFNYISHCIPGLTTLSIEFNELEDNHMKILGTARRLLNLDMSGNLKLTNQIWDSLAPLQDTLEELSIYGTGLDDQKTIDYLKNCGRLKTLHIDQLFYQQFTNEFLELELRGMSFTIH